MTFLIRLNVREMKKSNLFLFIFDIINEKKKIYILKKLSEYIVRLNLLLKCTSDYKTKIIEKKIPTEKCFTNCKMKKFTLCPAT